MNPLVVCVLVTALPLALLASWAQFYSHTEKAIFSLWAVGIVTAAVVYHSEYARRRALASAIFLPGSRLRYLLAGRFSAFLTSTVTVVLSLPTIAYFTLFAGSFDWLAVVAVGLLSGVLSVAISSRFSRHVTDEYTPGASAQTVGFLAAAPVVALHAACDYYFMPLPHYIDEPTLAGMLAAALEDLPDPTTLMDELLAALRCAEVLGFWLVKLDSARSAALIGFILLRDALVFVGLAACFTSLQALALSSLNRSIAGEENA